MFPSFEPPRRKMALRLNRRLTWPILALPIMAASAAFVESRPPAQHLRPCVAMT